MFINVKEDLINSLARLTFEDIYPPCGNWPKSCD